MKHRQDEAVIDLATNTPPPFFKSAGEVSQPSQPSPTGENEPQSEQLPGVGASIGHSRSVSSPEVRVHGGSSGVGPNMNWAQFLGLAMAANSVSEGDCVVWLSRLTTNGYPLLPSPFGTLPAHRYACAAWHGPEAVKGKDVHHVCGRPDCVNPAHLVPLTPAEHGAVHAGAMECPTPKRSESKALITWPEMAAALFSEVTP